LRDEKLSASIETRDMTLGLELGVEGEVSIDDGWTEKEQA